MDKFIAYLKSTFSIDAAYWAAVVIITIAVTLMFALFLIGKPITIGGDVTIPINVDLDGDDDNPPSADKTCLSKQSFHQTYNTPHNHNLHLTYLEGIEPEPVSVYLV